MIKIAIAGIFGRMGQHLCQQIIAHPDLNLIGGSYGTKPSHDTALYPHMVSPNIRDVLIHADVLIDFSVAHQVTDNLITCQQLNKLYVGGVTGLPTSTLDHMRAVSNEIPVFYDTNTSPGIAVLKYLAGQMSHLLPEAEIELFEMHHRAKRDAPSGTALSLAHHISCNREPQSNIVNRKATDAPHGARLSANEIGISFARLGEVPGQHDIIFACDNEIITLRHQVTDRSLFASGALKAATWLMHQPPGLYTMQDVLSSKRLSKDDRAAATSVL